jgi:hypothetical protein
VSLALDREGLAALLPDVPVQAEAQVAGFAVSPVTPQLLDPWLRFLSLLDAPRGIRVLAPLLEREILYRLLQGPQGGETHDQLRKHLGDFVTAYNFARRLKP